MPPAQNPAQAQHALGSYLRATVLVAFVDAVGIDIGLAVLCVPLALPLAALVFLGAFIPVIGAALSDAVAVLVALVTQGPVSAHIALHPLAVVLAIATGGVVAGIVGALLAVPLLAVANAIKVDADGHELTLRRGFPGRLIWTAASLRQHVSSVIDDLVRTWAPDDF